MSYKSQQANNKRFIANGFTLIEILIALLILAIGVLGIAALQFKVLQYSHDANIRSQINFLAYDISERMRANSANAKDYVKVMQKSSYKVRTSPPRQPCVQKTGADAANDIACWQHQIYRSLPVNSFAGLVGPDSNNVYITYMGWFDREGKQHYIPYSFRP